MMIMLTSLALGLSAVQDTDGPADQFQAALADLDGRWTGALIYRDYQTDARVELPHDRTISVSPDGNYVVSEETYTDPGYLVHYASLIAIKDATVQIASAGYGNLSTDRLTVVAFDPEDAGWRAILEGPGVDNDLPAQTRLTYHMNGDALSIEKTVQTEGDTAYRFRNGVQLNRLD